MNNNFTAKDFKDLEKYAFLPLRYYYSLNYLENNEKTKKNEQTSRKSSETLFKIYKNIDYQSIMNTFNYMFNNLKKGIFVIIHDNKLALFLPFYNGDRDGDDDGDRYENYKNMLNNLLKQKHRKIPNVEFFINTYNFPILKKSCNNLKMCPIFSPKITNKHADIIIPNENIDSDKFYNYMEEKFNLIYKNKVPKNCLNIENNIRKNIAIIACFRDSENGERERERRVYVKIMNKLLEPYCNFHIYIIEQSDDGQLFNIGKLKNIGFDIAKDISDYDHFIFTDIDMIPNYDLIKYFLITPEQPLSLAVRGTRYEAHRIQERKAGVPEKIFIGALVNFSKKNFIDINGYANNFWGWGGEDDSLIQRIKNAGYQNICYPANGCVIDIEEDISMKTINVKTKIKNVEKDLQKFEKRYNDLITWNNNGINSLNYKILNKNKINHNITKIKVDLLKNEDIKKYPEWFPKKSKNNQILKNISKKFAKMDTEMVIKYI